MFFKSRCLTSALAWWQLHWMLLLDFSVGLKFFSCLPTDKFYSKTKVFIAHTVSKSTSMDDLVTDNLLRISYFQLKFRDKQGKKYSNTKINLLMLYFKTPYDCFLTDSGNMGLWIHWLKLFDDRMPKSVWSTVSPDSSLISPPLARKSKSLRFSHLNFRLAAPLYNSVFPTSLTSS